MSTTAAGLVSAARTQVRQLSAAEFADEAAREGTVVIDLREPEELKNTGTITGAVHVPRGMLEFRADISSPYHDDRLQPEKPVRLYCASGGRSALAATTLAALGYTDVAHLTGGMKEWTDGRAPGGEARRLSESASRSHTPRRSWALIRMPHMLPPVHAAPTATRTHWIPW